VARRAPKARSFVIQKHAASHLHYDFRLELDGVLLSWAVPKGPSLDPQDKRLAMQVEDHPLEYGGFEGIIPPRQYGSGTVMLWDRGTWIPAGEPRAAYAKGHLNFELQGEKLKGVWNLVRTHGSKYGGKGKAWLLIKESDGHAQRGVHARIVDDAPDSVASGRSLEQIAQDREHEWHSNRSVKANVRAGAASAKRTVRNAKRANRPAPPPALAGAKAAPMPAALSPTLATLVENVPAGGEWLHEVKYDGYRMLCRIRDGVASIHSRNGKDWTAQMRPIAVAAQRLATRSAWLDGEVTVVGAQGRTSFQALQNALAGPGGDRSLTYFVFDLPYLDGRDLRNVELIERKRLLRELLGGSDKALRYSVDVQGSGAEFFKQACRLGLEGAVSKRATSVYRAGARTRDWVKVKCGQRQEMVIGGFTDPQGGRSGLGALLLGVNEPGGLRYSGKVGTGFDDRMLKALRRKLDKLTQIASPFTNPPRGFVAKGAHWVKPQLVAEIAFTEWSDGGALRHPSFQGLREDKNAAEVVRERPQSKPSPVPADAPGAVARVALSHPDKQLYPEAKLSKRDLAQYYESIADWILPHLRNRPLSLVRCPDGWNRECFYQKHAHESVHKAVSRVVVPEGHGKATYLAANTAAALVGLVQWGVLELHPWGSRAPKLDRPDRLIFDFDPDEGVSWKRIVDAVGLLKTLLDEIGLKGFLKTTGGKGLHVVVPIRPTLDWDQAKRFTKAIAALLARTFPERFTATLSKSRRKGRIFLDYLRNAEGATAIAPYAMRARANAPVSMPIGWEQLAKDVRFDCFNVRNVPARLNRMRDDPWAAFLKTRQQVDKRMFKRVGM
jgi:bifunctional non-homologous end joining protein LigD